MPVFRSLTKRSARNCSASARLSVKELLAIRQKGKFNERLAEMVKTDAEKKMLVDLAYKVGAEDSEVWKVDALRKLAETAKV